MLQGHIGVVRCIHLMEDRLASAGDCKRVMVWNAKVSKVLISLLATIWSALLVVCCRVADYSTQSTNSKPKYTCSGQTTHVL